MTQCYTIPARPAMSVRVPEQCLGFRLDDFLFNGLSVRMCRCFNASTPPILTIGDLILQTEDSLLAKKGLGRTSVRQIKTFLAMNGLALGMTKGALPGDHYPARIWAAHIPERNREPEWLVVPAELMRNVKLPTNTRRVTPICKPATSDQGQ